MSAEQVYTEVERRLQQALRQSVSDGRLTYLNLEEMTWPCLGLKGETCTVTGYAIVAQTTGRSAAHHVLSFCCRGEFLGRGQLYTLSFVTPSVPDPRTQLFIVNAMSMFSQVYQTMSIFREQCPYLTEGEDEGFQIASGPVAFTPTSTPTQSPIARRRQQSETGLTYVLGDSQVELPFSLSDEDVAIISETLATCSALAERNQLKVTKPIKRNGVTFTVTKVENKQYSLTVQKDKMTTLLEPPPLQNVYAQALHDTPKKAPSSSSPSSPHPSSPSSPSKSPSSLDLD